MDGWTASGHRKSCLMVFGVGGFSSCCCSLTGWCVTDARRSLVPSSTHSARLSRLTWISWRTIAAIFDNSRYSWETWGQKVNRGTCLFGLRCSFYCRLRFQLPWYPWSPGGPSIALPIDPLSPASPTSPGKQRNVISVGNCLKWLLSCPVTDRSSLLPLGPGSPSSPGRPL